MRPFQAPARPEIAPARVLPVTNPNWYRHDVIDIVWAARDQHEAGERLKELLGLEAGIPPAIVLDMQISRLTSESRDGIATNVAHLRRVLGRE